MSALDDQFRVLATVPFDVNPAGLRIREERGLGSQNDFIERLATRMEAVPGSDRFRTAIEGLPFRYLATRIVKGLLYELFPGLDYRESHFSAIELSPEATIRQLALITAMLSRTHLVRGDNVFQAWYEVQTDQGRGAWLIVFYECFGFFVLHDERPQGPLWETAEFTFPPRSPIPL